MNVAKWTAVGLALGAVTSVLPGELVFFAPLALAGALGLAWSDEKKRGARPVAGVIAVITSAVGVVVVASQLPLKYADRTYLEGLSSRCVSLGEALRSMHARVDGVGSEEAAREVCFPSVRPSMRQALASVNEQVGVKLRLIYCGNGATVLWGAEPISAGPVGEMQ